MHESFPATELIYSEEQELAGQVVLEKWSGSHTDELMKPLSYNPNLFPFQRLSVIELPAEPDIELATQLGAEGYGPNYGQLIEDLRRSGLIQELFDHALKGHSSVIVTPHLRNILDTPVSHNAAFVASGNPDFAERNVIIANHMVKRLEVHGIPVPVILQKSGRVLFGHPKDRAAELGMPAEIINSGNTAVVPLMIRAVQQGSVLHKALTETRAQKIIIGNGTSAHILPRVKESEARRTNAQMLYMVMLAMDAPPGAGQHKLIGPIQLFNRRDIHLLMRQSADVLTELTGEKVVYGLPEGAILLHEPAAKSLT